LTINGAESGIYLAVEEIDDRYLARHFEDGTGTLLDMDRAPLLYWGEDLETYTERQGAIDVDDGPDDDEDVEAMVVTTTRLLGSADDLTLQSGLPEVFDVDAWLAVAAANALTVNLGSANQGAGNYFLYGDPTSGKVHVLAWDMDASFGAYPPHATLEDRQAVSLSNPRLTPDPRPLIDRILGVPVWQARYLELLALQVPLLETQAAWAEDVAPWVADALDGDPFALYGGDLARQGMVDDIPGATLEAAEGVRGIPEPLPGLLPFIDVRLATARAALDGQAALVWPVGQTCTLAAGDVTVTLPEGSPGKLYLLVRGNMPGRPEATWATWYGALQEVRAGPIVACFPTGIENVRLLALVDLDQDGTIDPGVDLVGEADPSGAGLTAEVDVVDLWEGQTVWITRYGADVRP
jgi:hypothetical protein